MSNRIIDGKKSRSSSLLKWQSVLYISIYFFPFLPKTTAHPHPPSGGLGGVNASEDMNSSTGTTASVVEFRRDLDASDPYFAAVFFDSLASVEGLTVERSFYGI